MECRGHKAESTGCPRRVEEGDRDGCQEHHHAVQAVSSQTMLQHCVGRRLRVMYLFHVIHVVLLACTSSSLK